MPAERRIDWKSAWLSGLWLVGALAWIAATELLFQFGAAGGYFLLVGLGGVILVVSAVTLLIRGGRRLWKWRREGPSSVTAALGPVVAIVAVMVVFEPLSAATSKIGIRVALMAYRPAYERIVAGVRSSEFHGSGPYNRGALDGVEFMIEAGPPLRVAFPIDGLVDNWWGYVYDPTGDVAALGYSDPEIRNLFGGDLVSCSRIADDFFVCGFT